MKLEKRRQFIINFLYFAIILGIVILLVRRLTNPRIKATGTAISASEVRRLLKTQQFSRIREIVPDSTFAHLETHYRASAEVA